MAFDPDAPLDPDWITHPGASLEEILEARGLSRAEMSVRSGIAPAVLDDLLAGQAPLTEALAQLLEAALERPSAAFWIVREQHFREGLRAGKSWTP